MRRAVCPGSFDPVTNGHLDIVAPRRRGSSTRSSSRSGTNVSKSRLFDRRRADRDAASGPAPTCPTCAVEGFTGLLTTFCRERDVDAIVKGLRAASDFDYELPDGADELLPDRRRDGLHPDQPRARLRLLVSLVKEVAGFGGDVSAFVPASSTSCSGRLA